MWPVSFDLTAAFRCAAWLAAGVAVLWLVGVVRRDAKAEVIREINVAIEKTNADIDNQLSLDERIAQVAEAARKKALANAISLPAIAVTCPASKPQADALNAIK